MRLIDFYGRRIKRRAGDDSARHGLRLLDVIGDELDEETTMTLALPEIQRNTAPGVPQGRRGMRRPKTRA